MLKIKFVMFGILFVGCILTGCRSTSAPEEQKKMKIDNLREVDAGAVESFARAAAVDLIEGLKNADYNSFIKNLTPERQSKLTEKNFISVRQKFIEGPGVPVAMPEQVAMLDKQVVKIFVFTVPFARKVKAAESDEASTLSHDLLLGVSVGQADGKLYVVSFAFTDLFFF